MTNSNLLYGRMKQYQDKRKAVMDEYAQQLEWLADKKGSDYYNEEVKIAREKRDEALQTLRGEFDESARIAIKAMREANAQRTAVAPSEEELRIVQALKMRDTVGEEELRMIANAVRGNGLCLDIVNEVARQNNILFDFRSMCEENRLSPSFVSDKLNLLEDNIADFLEFDTERAARIAAAYHERHYGTRQDEMNIAKRPLFDSKEDFYRQIGWIQGDTLDRFMEAVDG